MNHAILTAIGTDRPGLVEAVSQFIFQRGGNIADSRMVNLRGQFAMMLLVDGDAAVIERIGAETAQLAETAELHVELRPADPAKPSAAPPARPYRLRATAMDQSGLVHRVAHLLRSMAVNIESLDTELTAAPITGAPVFEMELVLSLPQSVPLSKLRGALGALCDELNIDWQLSAM